MESTAGRGRIERQKSVSVDPLLMRGDYVALQPIDRSQKSTKATPEAAKTGSLRRRAANADDARPTTGSRLATRRLSGTACDFDDDSASPLRSRYIRWPPSPPTRSASAGDFCARNLRIDVADCPSEAGGCRLPGTRDSKALKNLFVLGGSVMCWLTAFSSIQSLQSTLNHRRTLGVASLATLYSAAVVSCFYAPPIIRRLSAKWTIVASYAVHLTFVFRFSSVSATVYFRLRSVIASYAVHLSYVAANFDETGSLLVPGALAAGALTGPLWTAQSTYLTTLALGDRRESVAGAEASVARFNGLFGALMQTSQIWGNLLSSIVLSAHNETFHLFGQPVAAGSSGDTVRRTGNASSRCAPRYFSIQSIIYWFSFTLSRQL